MVRELRCQRGAPLGGGAHQVEATAGRVHLLSQDAIGRALRKTDPAVHAGPQPVHRRRIDGVERALHRPPAKRPGFRIPAGSNSVLEPAHDVEDFRGHGSPDVQRLLHRPRRPFHHEAAALGRERRAQSGHCSARARCRTACRRLPTGEGPRGSTPLPASPTATSADTPIARHVLELREPVAQARGLAGNLERHGGPERRAQPTPEAAGDIGAPATRPRQAARGRPAGRRPPRRCSPPTLRTAAPSGGRSAGLRRHRVTDRGQRPAPSSTTRSGCSVESTMAAMYAAARCRPCRRSRAGHPRRGDRMQAQGGFGEHAERSQRAHQ